MDNILLLETLNTEHMVMVEKMVIPIVLFSLTIIYNIYNGLPPELVHFKQRIQDKKEFNKIIFILFIASIFIILDTKIVHFIEKHIANTQQTTLLTKTAIKEAYYILLYFGLIYYLYSYIYKDMTKKRNYFEEVINGISEDIKNFNSLSRNSNQQLKDDLYKLINDLGHLGELATNNKQTNSVIRKLKQILHITYDDFNLEYDILNKIIDALYSSLLECNTQKDNILEALKIYTNIIIEANNTTSNSNDELDIKTLNSYTVQIADYAMKNEDYNIVNKTLDIFKWMPKSENKFFKIGLLALEKQQYDITLKAINEMESKYHKGCIHSLYNYLGLLMHFRDVGPSTKKETQKRMNNISYSNDTLEKAIEFHVSKSHFLTADKLLLLQEELFPAKMNPKIKGINTTIQPNDIPFPQYNTSNQHVINQQNKTITVDEHLSPYINSSPPPSSKKTGWERFKQWLKNLLDSTKSIFW